MIRFPRSLLTVVAMLVLAGGVARAAAESSLANPPPGANNFSCVPSAAHPDPVVLVHGLGSTMGANWGYLAPLLAARGYCVFALTYGLDPRAPYFGGVLPIEQSASELSAFIDKVLTATGAAKVDLVGHSEGTFMPQYWLKFLAGASKTNRYVAMTPLYQGSSVYGLSTLRDMDPTGLSATFTSYASTFCGSCPEFLTGSAMVKKLNEGGAAVPGVQYTTIPTRYDELVTPYTSGILNAPNATNVILQDVCPTDLSEHGGEAIDPIVAQVIFNALDPAHVQTVACGGLPGTPPQAASPQQTPPGAPSPASSARSASGSRGAPASGKRVLLATPVVAPKAACSGLHAKALRKCRTAERRKKAVKKCKLHKPSEKAACLTRAHKIR